MQLIIEMRVQRNIIGLLVNNINMQKSHSFHIPVMGIGFTIDTPLKVSKYGIDSVISLVDDVLLEKIRKSYS